jgi:ribosomal peptide maturation radical SAM protein 1
MEGAPGRDVVLVSMPFGPLMQPSLALTLLKQAVTGSDVAVLYETLQFASAIGPDLYVQITNGEPLLTHLTGEWIFAEAAFGADPERSARYITEFLGEHGITREDRADGGYAVDPRFREAVLRARGTVDAYLRRAVERVLRSEPRVVGLTSVFQQQVASLALARRIKEHRPDVIVVMGGANCEGPMGAAVLRNFPFVDVAVTGEGEVAFADLVDRVLTGRDLRRIPGAVSQQDLGPLRLPSASNTARQADIDAQEVPDFADFFAQWEGSGVGEGRQAFLLFESSRGCWWGERRHCTFCGLNGDRMAFRSKPPARVVDELRTLTTRHPRLPIYAVDSIMDRRYFDEFLPLLAEASLGASLFYEVKANLTKDQLRALKAAGVVDIQPGIESLHDAVLRLMRKGVTAIHNIQLLKWCAELGLRPQWNLLWGFPGEPTSAYTDMTRLIPQLTHLAPPVGASRIRLDRFSPHYDHPEEFGFTNVRPVPAYEAIYPLSAPALGELAYFFAYDYRGDRTPEAEVNALEQAVAEWKEIGPSAGHWWVDDGSRTLVWDLRTAVAVHTTLTGLERDVFLACDEGRSSRELVQLVRGSTREPVPTQTVQEIVRRLVAARLVITDGRRYLTLAVPLGDRQVPAVQLARLGSAIFGAAGTEGVSAAEAEAARSG